MQKNKVAIWIPYKKLHGLGHYYRNLWITEELTHSYFFYNGVPEYNTSGFEKKIICELERPEEIERFLLKNNFNALLIDNYFLTEEVYQYFQKCKLKTVLFDNTFRNLSYSALLNNNPFSSSNNYPLANKNTQYFLGADYYWFRDEINIYKGSTKQDQIFVSFGGSDVKKMFFKIIPILPKDKIYIFNIGLGSGEQYYKEVLDHFKIQGLVGRVQYNSPTYLKDLSESRFAILTSSTSTYEAEFYKTRYICFSVVINQDFLEIFLENNGISVFDSTKIQSIPQSAFVEKNFKLIGLTFGKKRSELINFLRGNYDN